MSVILVDRRDATAEQLLVHLLDRFDLIDQRLNRMEIRMSDLTSSVDNLQRAVDGVAQRALVDVVALQENLASTRERLATALADDQRAADLLAESEAAVTRINAAVDQLNALGTDPSTPVGPVDESIPVPPTDGSVPEAPVDTPAPDAPTEPATPEAPVDTPAPDAPAPDPVVSAPDAPVDTPAPTPDEAPTDTPVAPEGAAPADSAGVAASPTPDAP